MTDLKVKYLFQGQKGQNILNVLLQTLVLLMGGLTRITPSPRTKSIGIFRLVGNAFLTKDRIINWHLIAPPSNPYFSGTVG